jgi:hypothetical protein
MQEVSIGKKLGLRVIRDYFRSTWLSLQTVTAHNFKLGRFQSPGATTRCGAHNYWAKPYLMSSLLTITITNTLGADSGSKVSSHSHHNTLHTNREFIFLDWPTTSDKEVNDNQLTLSTHRQEVSQFLWYYSSNE